MSTAFRLVGSGVRLSLPKIRKLAAQAKGRVMVPVNEVKPDDHMLLQLPVGYLHLYRTGKAAWNAFERYGGNGDAADLWIECLNAAGYSVLSEHDEGYFHG